MPAPADGRENVHAGERRYEDGRAVDARPRPPATNYEVAQRIERHDGQVEGVEVFYCKVGVPLPCGVVAVGADDVERAEEQGVGQAQELREAAARAPRVREQRRREPRRD